MMETESVFDTASDDICFEEMAEDESEIKQRLLDAEAETDAKTETSAGVAEVMEATKEMPPNPSLRPSLFDRYRKLSGRELDDEQKLRLSGLIDTFGMREIIEFEHMILPLEYYLFLNMEGLNGSAARIAALIEERFRVLSEDLKKIELPKEFLSSLEMKGEENFRRLISKIEEDVTNAGGRMSSFAHLTEDTLPLAKEVIQNFNAIPERVEARISENLTRIAVREIEARKNDVQWFEQVRRNALFVFLFGFFAIAFFLMGVLSYGAGFPPWIAGVVARGKMGFGLLSSIALGLPMSWCLWIGMGVLGVLWICEHRKSLDSFGNFARAHAVFACISVALTAALFGWFLF
jgi:hypothetical protein